ncbi:MAG: hypothetical protein H0T91_12850, partial [Propionibacteriaceae bacterium]|nr:hypothetical protein [Propionibacteriaceae bacterium]
MAATRLRAFVRMGEGLGRHEIVISDAEYVLPLRWSDDTELDDLTRYLTRLVAWITVTVVDGSSDELFEAHRAAWPAAVNHRRPEPWTGPNGKVAGVMTGVRHAQHEKLVLADDDVRYELGELASIVDLLSSFDLVRPQNYYRELPWFARWDTAR